MDLVLALLVLMALLLLHRARTGRAAERLEKAAGAAPAGRHRPAASILARAEHLWPWVAGAAVSPVAGFLGWRIMGPLGVLFAAAGPILPPVLSRRRTGKTAEALETQLGDLAGAIALGVRSGLSIPQSLEFALEDASPPIRPMLERVMAERELGADLETALQGFSASIDSDDGRLLMLILLTHAKSGGNLAVALQEVAATIRHRLEARRELQALTAQGRISGAILGALPIGFFILMAATSRKDLADVYRSAPGIAMVAVGLLLEGLSYLWIRRLLRIEA